VPEYSEGQPGVDPIDVNDEQFDDGELPRRDDESETASGEASVAFENTEGDPGEQLSL